MAAGGGGVPGAFGPGVHLGDVEDMCVDLSVGPS